MATKKKIIGLLAIILSYWIVYSLILSSTCVFKNISGLPCPGCGLTRSGLALLSGNLQKSLYYHSLLIPILILIVLALTGWIKKIKPIYLWLMVVIIFLYYAFRMWLFFPHTPPLDYQENNLIKWVFDQLGQFF